MVGSCSSWLTRARERWCDMRQRLLVNLPEMAHGACQFAAADRFRLLAQAGNHRAHGELRQAGLQARRSSSAMMASAAGTSRRRATRIHPVRPAGDPYRPGSRPAQLTTAGSMSRGTARSKSRSGRPASVPERAASISPVSSGVWACVARKTRSASASAAAAHPGHRPAAPAVRPAAWAWAGCGWRCECAIAARAQRFNGRAGHRSRANQQNRALQAAEDDLAPG